MGVWNGLALVSPEAGDGTREEDADGYEEVEQDDGGGDGDFDSRDDFPDGCVAHVSPITEACGKTAWTSAHR